ncbi:MAG: thermonuclease family protein [Gallionella sp.]
MKRQAARWFCAVLLFASAAAFGEEFFARVIVVIDGDTVLIRRASGLVKIRLAEIDAPEIAQAFGAASKRSLSGMVMGRRVRIASEATDQYGRMVAHLGVDGLDVNAEQIRRGMAWEYSNHHSDKALIALQNEARLASRGLWAQSDPMPPWEWRLRHRYW